jgi:hypothetical protein
MEVFPRQPEDFVFGAMLLRLPSHDLGADFRAVRLDVLSKRGALQHGATTRMSAMPADAPVIAPKELVLAAHLAIVAAGEVNALPDLVIERLRLVGQASQLWHCDGAATQRRG